MLVKLEYHKEKFQICLLMMHWKNSVFMNWKKLKRQVALTHQDEDPKLM